MNEEKIVPIETQAPEEQQESAEFQLLIEARKSAEEWREKAMRLAADAENTRKRAERDLAETQKYAVSGFAKDMVNVAENLIRALGSVPEEALGAADPLLKTIHAGVEMTLKELLSVFEKNGLKRIDPLGAMFDHNLHQAIAQLEVPGAAAGSVVQVVQAGYQIHDRLLRPAMVAVAKVPTATEPKPSVDTIA